MEKANQVYRYPKASGLLLGAGVVAYCSTVLLLISFASPYWLESYRGGQRRICVGFGLVGRVLPQLPAPRLTSTTRPSMAATGPTPTPTRTIRDWLLPGWFMFVQSMMTLALMFAFTALVLVSILLMRFLLRFEIIVLMVAFILEAITSIPLFLSVAVFGGMRFERSWLQNPIYNHLSWAYALAVVAFFFHTVAAMMLLGETLKARERRRRANNLIYNMQPRPGTSGNTTPSLLGAEPKQPLPPE
uniref:Putative conserved plasma membrane protein n=2 Tax=Ixodes ricinus TaxID=34613 RepID=A0A090XBA6_IXORI